MGLALTMVGVTGCTSMNRMAQGHPDRTSGQYKDDKALEAKVDKALIGAPVYKYPDVKVTVYRGEVQLSGFVTTDAQKEEATRIAQQVSGVNDVQNNLLIKKITNTPVVGQSNPPNNNNNPPNDNK
jgi:osmotically-inducible protein OsmY